MVNTCGFIDSAKKDSIDTLLAAADTGAKVVAVGCLAERYGEQLADVAARGRRRARLRLLRRHRRPARRRRRRPAGRAARPARPPHAAAGHARRSARPPRRRRACPGTPGCRPRRSAPASTTRRSPTSSSRPGCDRRCTFCAIPSFRGSFVSRPPADVLAEAQWLAVDRRARARAGQRELDLLRQGPRRPARAGGAAAAAGRGRRHRAGPGVLPAAGRAAARTCCEVHRRRRPASRRTSTCPSSTPAPPVLRRMKRFGGTEAFLDLLARARALAPDAGARSNVIVGFPGETEDDVARARALPVRGPARRDRRVRLLRRGRHRRGRLRRQAATPTSIAERVERVSALADELVSQRAEDRVGTRVEVLVEDGRRPTSVDRPRRAPGPGRRRRRCAWSARDGAASRAARRGVRRRHRRRRPGRRAGGRAVVTRRPSRRRPSRSTPRPGGCPADAAAADDPIADPPSPVVGLEHRQRADRAPAGAGAGVRRRAVRRRRPRRPAGGSLAWARLRGRVGHRPLRRRHRPQARPGHRVRQAGRPDRRQGADRRRADRAVGAGRPAVVGHRRRSWSARSASRCCGSG